MEGKQTAQADPVRQLQEVGLGRKIQIDERMDNLRCISSHTVHQQMAEQERRWQETTAQIQNKLDMVIANTSGDEMISQVDFRSLNFDDVLGKDQFVVFFLSFQLHVK